MSFTAIVYYFLSLGASAGTIVLSQKLLKRYGYKFLNYYFLYIIFFYVYGFLNFTGRLMTAQIFKQSSYTLHIASQVTAVTASPMLLISLFFALSWIRELSGKRIPMILKSSFWTVQTLALTAFFYGVANLEKTKDYSLAGPIFQVVTALEIIIILFILIQLYFPAGGTEDKTRKRLARNLCHIYLAGFSLMVIFGKLIRTPFYIYPEELVFQIAVTFLFFFLNIPPLFYLGRFLKKNHGKWGIHPPDPARLANFYTRYTITEREQEIIDRLIKGKTNEEIGDELFISTKTVKNNVSNIYKKTRVKNRVQLTNLIREL
ncbi:MAG: response regulator transcription factor [bacterium]|nr:response regulator transcription factor [bacterium]